MNKEKENKIAGISARITEVIEYLGETSNSFAFKLGYQRAQTIYDIQKMKSAPSFDFFQRFSSAGFSEIINLDWLLSGKGEMLCNNSRNSKPTDDAPSSLDASTALLTLIREKDTTIREQAEEIGRLKARIEELERVKGNTASDVIDSMVANAG